MTAKRKIVDKHGRIWTAAIVRWEDAEAEISGSGTKNSRRSSALTRFTTRLKAV